MDIEPTYRFNTQDEYDEHLSEQEMRDDYEHDRYDMEKDRDEW